MHKVCVALPNTVAATVIGNYTILYKCWIHHHVTMWHGHLQWSLHFFSRMEMTRAVYVRFYTGIFCLKWLRTLYEGCDFNLFCQIKNLKKFSHAKSKFSHIVQMFRNILLKWKKTFYQQIYFTSQQFRWKVGRVNAQL